MPKITTHYDNLQVAPNASPEVIKGAYRYLSQKYHPDKNPTKRDAAEKVTKILNEAYEVLSDPIKRREHDAWIKAQGITINETASSNRQPTQDEEAGVSNPDIRSNTLALWNPNVAANWCLLFPFAFGAFLHAKNWAELGDRAKAKKSLLWAYGNVLLVIAWLFLSEATTESFVYLNLVLLLCWYFSIAKSQVRVVEEKFGKTYERKGWLTPIALGIVFLSFLSVVKGIQLEQADSAKQQQLLNDIGGTWVAQKDGTTFVFRLGDLDKSIVVGDRVVPVTQTSYDLVNQIFTISVPTDPPQSVQLKRVIQADGAYLLWMSENGGPAEYLTYVGP